MPSKEQQLPIILCIHGFGTNGTIFRLQAASIISALESSFKFVFIDAPFDAQPGPGIIPTFADYKPFRRWHGDASALDVFDFSPVELARERGVTRKILEDHMDHANDVVGIMAFCQGTRVAAGLLLEERLCQNIKFVIQICGMFPALPVDGDGLPEVTKKLAIPSIHVQGSHDPWKPKGTRMRNTYFEGDLAHTVGFAGGHRVPKGAEVTEIANWVIETYS